MVQPPREGEVGNVPTSGGCKRPVFADGPGSLLGPRLGPDVEVVAGTLGVSPMQALRRGPLEHPSVHGAVRPAILRTRSSAWGLVVKATFALCNTQFEITMDYPRMASL